METMKMSYELLKTITGNFSKDNVLGSGTFGVVYKVWLKAYHEWFPALSVVNKTLVQSSFFFQKIAGMIMPAAY